MAVLPLSNVVVERMKNAQSRHPLVSVRDWNDERSRLRGKNGRPINHGHSSAKTSLRRTSQPISVQRNVFPNKGFSASTSRVMCWNLGFLFPSQLSEPDPRSVLRQGILLMMNWVASWRWWTVRGMSRSTKQACDTSGLASRLR